MTKNLLVELGIEELPAYVVTASENQLGQKMADFLKKIAYLMKLLRHFQLHVD